MQDILLPVISSTSPVVQGTFVKCKIRYGTVSVSVSYFCLLLQINGIKAHPGERNEVPMFSCSTFFFVLFCLNITAQFL